MGGASSCPGGARGRAVRRLQVGAVAVVAALVPLLVVTSPADARKVPSLRCGIAPTTDVRLTEDLTCDVGFFANPNLPDRPPVNIDLGGHTLTVTNGTCQHFGTCGAISGHRSVTNGSVVGDLQDVDRTSRVRLSGYAYLNETVDPALGPAVFERSTVVDGGLVIFGPNVTIRANRLERSWVRFEDVKISLTNSHVLDNRIVDAPGSGIWVHEGWACERCTDDITGVVAGNTVLGSAGAGIEVSGQLDSMGRLEIRGNTVRDNAGDGIRVDLANILTTDHRFGPVVISANRADRNGGHGINSDWTPAFGPLGVVDGGGNSARANALAPACVGVTCDERGHPGDVRPTTAA